MSLPLPWVEKIFHKLAVTYGRDFLMRWDGVPLDEVKADWAKELRCFSQNPQAIAFGLEHCLSGKPPTVHEFKAACLRRPLSPSVVLLAGPPASPQRVAAEVARWEPLRSKVQRDDKAWAKSLLDRHSRGERVPRFALLAAQQVAGQP